MATVRNPVGVLSPIGQALENLGQAFFSGPSPYEQQATAAQMDVNRARAAKLRRETEDLQSQAFNRGGLARMFRQTDPAQGIDPSQFAASSYLAGTDPSKIGDLFLFHEATRGAPTSDVVRAFAGSGRGLGSNQALTLEHQQANRAQDIAADREEALAKIGAQADADLRVRQTAPTFAEARGQTLADLRSNQALTPEQEREVIGANPSYGTPRNYLTQDGTQGITLDGITDAATGQPIPPGSTVFTGQVQPDDPSGLTTSTRSGLQQAEASQIDFMSTLGELRQVAEEDPTLFGTVGNIRRGVQDVGLQLRSLSQLTGRNYDVEFDQAADALIPLGANPEFFDPNLPDIQKLATLTAYKAAAALADQTGRGLSDKDFRYFRQIVGDPTSWLANQESFLAGLNRLEQITQRRIEQLRQMRQGGPEAVEVPQPGQQPAPQAPAEGGEVFEFDPATGDFRQVQ